MEDEIFKILKRGRNGDDRTKRLYAQTIAAYVEQNYYPGEFVEWKDNNVGKTTTSHYWYRDKRFNALEEVYQHWVNEIKK